MERLPPDFLRHAPVVGFRYPAADGRQRVRVAAERDGQSDALLVVPALEETDDGLRHRALAAAVEAIRGADFPTRPPQVVAERVLDVFPYLVFRLPVAGQEDTSGYGLGSSDTFRVIVGYFGARPCRREGLVQRAERPAHGTDAHRRAVAPTVVGQGVIGIHPAFELFPETGIGVFPGIFFVECGVILAPVQEAIHRRHRQHRVVGEAGEALEQRELRRLDAPAVRFVGRADHVSGDSAQKVCFHFYHRFIKSCIFDLAFWRKNTMLHFAT